MSKLNAQSSELYWEGGYPDKESVWEIPQNWEARLLPDEDDHVIIRRCNSGHNSHPVLTRSTTIRALELHSGAWLEIEANVVLTIDGSHQYSEGNTNINGKIVNNGIILKSIDRPNHINSEKAGEIRIK